MATKVEAAPHTPARPRRSLGALTGLLVVPASLWYLILLVVPLLIVVVTERIPRRDVAEAVELANLRGARIIGPNCLGLIVPGVCKMGGIGGPAKDAAKAYNPGKIGVMSRPTA